MDNNITSADASVTEHLLVEAERPLEFVNEAARVKMAQTDMISAAVKKVIPTIQLPATKAGATQPRRPRHQRYREPAEGSERPTRAAVSHHLEEAEARPPE